MNKRDCIVYEALPGDDITTATERMVAMADEKGFTVTCKFNEQQLLARPGDKAEDIANGYMAECERASEVYKKSPKGVADAKRHAEWCKGADAAAAEGVLSFDVADKEGWALCVENNQDGYGSCGVRYAARWANYMEKVMAGGAKLEDIAERTAREADTEGITGFMYSYAVGVLSQAWRHGEALRRWHNLDSQIGNEGEKANESGGVLNPALLSMGG